MGDHDKGKRVEEPGIETKVWKEPWFDRSLRLVHAPNLGSVRSMSESDPPTRLIRFSSSPLSHDTRKDVMFGYNRAMVGWIECRSVQGVQDAKGHVLPRVMRVQRVPRVEELLDPKPDWAWASLWPKVKQGRANQELRMVVVKPRSREDSVSERLASVWLDNIREELVIVYETVNKINYALYEEIETEDVERTRDYDECIKDCDKAVERDRKLRTGTEQLCGRWKKSRQSCDQRVAEQGLSMKQKVWIGGKSVEGNLKQGSRARKWRECCTIWRPREVRG
ncbi:hypothetical protein Bca52824_006950 [Brassica carinata]|uniref:Uncharacterized protein n=1 Tax=Brassica carinata TaxID=52824 RepID=A0A8X8B7P6_BRACI|nr:hypothetical protein Bca52824_006950 [Brassica carinata]